MQNTKKKLVALDANTYSFFFNSTGFFLSVGSWCGWMDYANFDTFEGGYDNRFIDYLGTWTILAKRGFAEVPNDQVTAWAGNVMDPSGVFPNIMYMWKKSGIYAGVDVLSSNLMIDGGGSYFYPTIDKGKPDFSEFESGTMESL